MHADKKTEFVMILLMSLLFGMIFWLVDGLFEYQFFHENLSFMMLEGPQTLWQSLFTKVPPHSLFVRLSFIAASLLGGVLTARFVYRKRASDELLLQTHQEKSDLQNQVHQFQKMEPMGLLVCSVAHDLNNILSGVVSYPEILLKDPELNGKHRELLTETLASGQRAVAVVSDLLTISRGVTSQKVPLDLNTLVRDFLSSSECCELQKAHPAVAVRTDLDATPALITGSALHIRKALMNLVVNAVEAVTGEGSIRIHTGQRQLSVPHSGYIHIPAGDYVVLSVSDTGEGISPADIGKIFEPFYTRKMMGRSGTGLGLAVVWNAVQDHGGYIDVISGPHGTEFRLYFAATHRTAAQPSAGAGRVPEDYQGHGETILVIDDEETQRDIACRMLDLLGYRTAAVESGEAALVYLEDRPVDLLVLDMYMKQGMSGPETYEKIRQIHPRQKAIIASGYAEDQAVRRAQAAGAGAFLSKPYTMETVGLAIRKELSGG